MTPKTRLLSLCGAACLAGMTLIGFALRRGVDPATAPASAPVAERLTTPAVTVMSPPPSENMEEAGRKVVSRFIGRMASWETARHPESDRIEEELKAMITDDNAAVILQALPERFQSTYLGNEMLARWARRDRLAAVRWLGTRSEPTQIQILTAVRGWGGDDDAALLRHVDEQPAGAWKQRLTAGLAQDALIHHDPELAFSMAALLDPGGAQLRLMRDAAMKWSTWDPRAVLDQIERLPEAATQEKLIPYVAIGYASFAPQDAANWLLRSSVSGDSLAFGLAGVIQAWASRHDPAAAAKWIELLPRGPVRDRAVEALLSVWIERNPREAKGWIVRFPEDSGRQAHADPHFSPPN
jgi:hypothetical protein